MCIDKPECQRCETCGLRKYQLWVDSQMHERGCPWGFAQMNSCPDAINRARLVHWARNNDVRVTDTGIAFCNQMEAAGVDLNEPPIQWEPTP